MPRKSVDFEVFGRVQGGVFRRHAKEQADRLGLTGWCQNTRHGTVIGHLQGPPEELASMMQWLTGSPNSIVEKAEFSNLKDITNATFANFGLR